MESAGAVKSDGIRLDARNVVQPSPAALTDDPLSIFAPESGDTTAESADIAVPSTNAMQAPAPSAPFVPAKTNAVSDRTTELVNHLKRALGALDVARDLEKAVNSRLGALKKLEQVVRDRADALESLKQDILEGTARADDVVRSIKSFEPQLADLKEREQGLRAVESLVAAFEERARTVTTDLERHVDACEAREELVVEAAEQLGRRTANTIADLEGRVADSEARVHIAAETIVHLDDVSSQILSELRKRLDEADEKRRAIDQKITEAGQVAASLSDLEQRLPRIGQCNQDLARIELVVPQVEQRLEDLDERLSRQISVLAANEQLVHQALDEAEKSTAVVSDLESRIADLSRSRQQLDGLEQWAGQLEARAAAAGSEFAQATRAKNDLEPEVTALQDQFRRMAETADDEAKKLGELKAQATRYQYEQAERASAVSALESRLADINKGHQLLERVEQQLGQLEARSATVVGALNQATGATNGLEREVVELHDQLRRMTGTGDAEAKKLVEFTQRGERYQHEQTQRASAVLAGLESRMAEIASGSQQLDGVEQQLKLLEARSATFATEVRQATDAKNDLDQEVAALRNQLQQMTKAADDEAKKLVDLEQQAERYQREETPRVSAALLRLEARMTDIASGYQQLDRVEHQLKLIEARSTACATEVRQATGAKNDLKQEVTALENQLQQMTKASDDESKKLVRLEQRAKRYQDETPRVSAALSGLEARMTDIDRSCQQLAAVDKQVGQLEQRAAAAAATVKQVTGAKSALQDEIAELHNQLRQLTNAVQEEAKTLAELKRQAKRREIDRASLTDDDDQSVAQELGRRVSKARLSLTPDLRRVSKSWSSLTPDFRRVSKTWSSLTPDLRRVSKSWSSLTPHLRRASKARLSLTPDRLVVGGIAMALSVAIVVLVGGLWRFTPVKSDTAVKPVAPPLLSSRPLEFAPTGSVAIGTPATLSASNEPPTDNRPPSVEPPVAVARVAISQSVAANSGNGTVAVPQQSLRPAGQLPQFSGTLIIESEPVGATAFVNQQSVGTTPVALQGLRVGSYVVRVEYEGYERWSGAVTVSAIHEARVTATLRRESSR